MAENKTNALRLLDRAKLPYTVHTYDAGGGAADGETVAALVGKPSHQVYKTLCTQSPDRRVFVCMIPVHESLDLKLCAAAFGVKSLSMLPLDQLLPTTGYVRGGCSPIGMKKPFPTCLEEGAELLDTLLCSGGRVGLQIELSPQTLASLIGARFAPLCQR